MAAKSGAPKGVKITRNGNNLYAEWECGSANYDAGQELQVYKLHPRRIWNGKSYVTSMTYMWVDISVGKTTRKKSIGTLADWVNYHASKIRVRGRKDDYYTGSGSKRKHHVPAWSDWVQASRTFRVPQVPTVSVAQGSGDAQCTLSWTVGSVNATNDYPFSSIEYQTFIVENQTSASFPESMWNSTQKGWSTGTSASASGSVTKNNNVVFTSSNTFTRVVRARATGAVGTSAWSTPAYYTYATPQKVTISSGTATGTSSYTCDVSWNNPATFARPIDGFQVKYLMGTPTSTNWDVPAGANWDDAGGVQPNHQKAFPFTLSSVLDHDEALWFRVDSIHGTRTQYGNPRFIRFGGVKPMQTTDVSIEYDSETRVLTIGESYSSGLSGVAVKVDVPHYNNAGAITTTKTYTIDGELEISGYTLPTNIDKVTFKARAEWGSSKTSDVSKYFYPKTAASPYAYCPVSINVSKGSAVGSVNLSWTSVLGDAEEAEVGYSTNQVNWTVTSAITTTSTTITDIDYDVQYWYRVRSKSSRGETKWSDATSFTLKSSDLAKPTSLGVTRNGKDGLRVTWRWNDFSQADAIEISWADDSNAWNSSKKPDSEELDKRESNGVFYISELERDKRWYVRARFKAANAYSGYIERFFDLPIEPIAPTGVTFTRTEKLNTPRISWKWSWDDAESAEISWADNTGAWTATDGLETTTIENTQQDFLDISNLETGKIWYARVKLIFGKYSAESGIVQVDLRTNPATPSVTLSDPSIPALLGKTDVSWTYFCEDGLEQQSATVWICDDEGVPIRQLVSVNDATTTATIYAETYGLEGDTEYHLVVKVTSTSGLQSEWSVPAKLFVSNVPEAHITETSLEYKTVGDNPQTYTGDIVTIDNSEGITEIQSLKVTLEPIQSGSGTPSPDNVRPISGWTEVETIVSPTTEAEDGTTYTTDLGRTVYGGTLDVVKGTLNSKPYYPSYDGETLTGEWISDRDEYIAGTTPTIGAQVVNIGAEGTDYQLTAQQIALLTGTNNVWSDGDLEVSTLDDARTGNFLTVMPLTLSATGIGNKGTVTAYVERSRPYFVQQPDEKQAKGHEGEIVLLNTRNGDGSFSFGISDLKGALDDGGAYRLAVIVKDLMGQSAEASIDFEVMWEHQAIMPDATVETDGNIVKITPIRPEDAWDGDYCEIYRLSADTPQLIVARAEFGTTYVDPYPTLGEFGGHRIVYRTINGDFITADKILAIKDFETSSDAEFPEEGLDAKKSIIDFGTGRVELDRNLDVDNKWEKDFVETSYLGGSIQGDWNPAVRRISSVSSCSITLTDEETIKDMRRLAVYTGVCHVRTPDGSSYAADVQVSETWSHDRGFLIAEFALEITRVDSDGMDGMTLAEWEAGND